MLGERPPQAAPSFALPARTPKPDMKHSEHSEDHEASGATIEWTCPTPRKHKLEIEKKFSK